MSSPDAGSSSSINSRIAEQRSADEDRLLLAAGKLANMPLAEPGKIEPLHDLVQFAFFLGADAAEPAILDEKSHGDDFFDGDGEVPIDGFELRHITDAFEGGAPQFGAAQANMAARQRNHAEDRAQEGGLAAAIGSDDGHKLPRPNFQRNFLQRRGRAIGGAHLGQLDQRRGVFLLLG